MAAVVLGTALSTLGAPAPAAASISEIAVTNLSRYCTACWRNARLPADRWGDCTQEVLSRLLDRVSPQAWDLLLAPDSEERRELVRAIDAVKKRTLREWQRFTLLTGPVADSRYALEQERAESREAVQRAARNLLSNRQQRILHLAFEGSSIPDIALALTLSPERVSDEKYKAIRKLRGYFQESGIG